MIKIHLTTLQIHVDIMGSHRLTLKVNNIETHAGLWRE